MKKPFVIVCDLFRDVVPNLRQHGPFGAARIVRHRLSEVLNEWRLNIRTWQFVWLRDYGIHNEELHDYQPTDYRTLKRSMKYVNFDDREQVFLDIGCGMGRAVILAATYPFKRVIGVELSAELTAKARENLNRTRRKLMACSDVELIATDATEYGIPEDVTVVFFYTPFRGAALTQVMENIRRSLEDHPRKITAVFKNVEKSHFDDVIDSRWIRKRDQFSCFAGHTVGVYELLPAPEDQKVH
jgi:SAM-dependent methyltransferase